jgi:excisionase family DNA binding protein
MPHIVTAPDPDDDLLTPREVAQICGVSAVTVGRWARDGVLKPAMRTPGGQRRFRRADVRALHEAQSAGRPRQLEEDAVRLYRQGWPIRRVAAQFDYSYGRMRRLLIRHGALRNG